MPDRLTIERVEDAAAFEAAVSPFLLRREAENCLMLGLTSQLRLQTASAPASSPYFAIARKDGAVVGAGLIAGFLLILSAPIEPDAIAMLARDVAGAVPNVPGVVGAIGPSRQLAEAWTSFTGRAHRLNMSERIFSIDRLIPPRPVEGRMRIADAQDRGSLARWLREFALEALGQMTDLEANDRFALRWIERQGRTMYLWLDGSEPVSMVGVSGETPNGIRVAPVYTPPALRGRGYASALTAAVTQAQFDAGKRYCFLYTDLANPTSNHIYQAIGYQPVADVAEYRFEVPSAA